jgi:hypothetical protein
VTVERTLIVSVLFVAAGFVALLELDRWRR